MIEERREDEGVPWRPQHSWRANLPARAFLEGKNLWGAQQRFVPGVSVLYLNVRDSESCDIGSCANVRYDTSNSSGRLGGLILKLWRYLVPLAQRLYQYTYKHTSGRLHQRLIPQVAKICVLNRSPVSLGTLILPLFVITSASISFHQCCFQFRRYPKSQEKYGVCFSAWSFDDFFLSLLAQAIIT